MITREFLVTLNKMNTLLPEKVYLAYDDIEIIEIFTDIKTSIELTNGIHLDAIDIDLEKIKLSAKA